MAALLPPSHDVGGTMAQVNKAGMNGELETLRTEVAQLREIVAALVNLVVENQAAEEFDGDVGEDSFVPEVGTGTKFGWGM